MSSVTNAALLMGIVCLGACFKQKGGSSRQSKSEFSTKITNLALFALGVCVLGGCIPKAGAQELPLQSGALPPHVKQAINNLAVCPFSKKLSDYINSGELKLQCLPEQFFNGPSDGFIQLQDRMISVPCQNPNNDLTSRILFETINYDKRDQLMQQVLTTCDKTADVHAFSIEKIEYETVLQHHEIAKKCVSLGLWPAKFDLYGEKFKNQNSQGNWNSFKVYHADHEFTGHTDLIRKNWYQLCASVTKYQEWMISKIPEWQAKAKISS